MPKSVIRLTVMPAQLPRESNKILGRYTWKNLEVALVCWLKFIVTFKWHTTNLFAEGKDIMREGGLEEFTKAASKSYSNISEKEKAELRKLCVDRAQPLTSKTIKKDGKKIFLNIDKQVYSKTIIYANTVFLVLL